VLAAHGAAIYFPILMSNANVSAEPLLADSWPNRRHRNAAGDKSA